MNASATTKCPKCGVDNAAISRFCGACGQSLTAPAAPALGGLSSKRTMMGMAPGLVHGPESGHQPAGPDPRSAAGAGAPPPSRANVMPPPPAGAAPAPGRGEQRTMMGVPSVPGLEALRAEAAKAKAADHKPTPPRLQQTMVGVSNAGLQEALAKQSEGTEGQKLALSHAKTQLGLPSPLGAEARPEPAGAPTPAHDDPASADTLAVSLAQRAAVEDSTGSPGARPAPAQSASRVRREAAAASPIMQGADDTYEVRGKKRGGGGAWIAVVLLMLGGGGGAAWWFLMGSASAGAEVRLSAGDHGQQLRFELRHARAGSKLRFAGQEQALRQGVASFPLAPSSLKLGKNSIRYELIEPGGATHVASVDVDVTHRVFAALEALQADPPAFEVVVQAVHGTKVEVEGQPLKLDSRGEARHHKPLSPGQSEIVELSATYVLELPGGERIRGTVATKLGRAQLRVDTPGNEAWTEQARIEVAGTTSEGASVTVNGQAAQVEDGHFKLSVPLPTRGEYTLNVVARASERAPASTQLVVHRVASLRAAAARYAVDRGLTYAAMAKDPAQHRGKRVEFVGRVYNVDTHGAQGVLQLQVRDCPPKAKCPLWVTHAKGPSAAINHTVRVLGEVRGVQQFRSESDAVLAVPSVHAAFVLRPRRSADQAPTETKRARKSRRKPRHKPASGPVMPQ